MAELIAIVILLGVVIIFERKNLKRRMRWTDNWNNKVRDDFSKSLGAVWDNDGNFLGMKDDMRTVDENRKRWEKAKKLSESYLRNNK